MNTFLRILSVLYFLGAALHLADLFNLRLPFSEMSLTWKVWIVFLFIADSIAAIGLWKRKNFGVWTFLFVAIAQLIAYIGFKDIFGNQLSLIIFHSVCLLLYFWFQANRRGVQTQLASATVTKASSPKRILVIGCSGGGKSTLTRGLSEKLHLPAIHLDVHFWKPNWTVTEEKEWREKIEALTKTNEWVMDGTFANSFDIRFPQSDLIILLDQPRLLCMTRALLRVFKYNKIDRRPDMAEGCEESFDFEFYKYIWSYNRKVFPQILAAIKKYSCESKVIYLASDRDAKALLESL